jgi:TonB family protein
VGFLSVSALAEADDSASKDKKSIKADADPVYEPGGDVTRPKLVHSVEPAFSTKSNEAFVEGTVTVSAVVTTHGVLTGMQVLKGLNAAQDRSALDALKEWRFEPGTKGGKPVNVRVKIQVDFHLL